ncbi:hypothetical protein [Rhizohabitans arisaemae]|uniref:hypothetical protein n=1 Tax=Rhizohabitans arisaemae TaxID=2720610 RepID=UPI0024B131AF|nr:hypothetical protein [Rhizohabitans arisaemae]
MPVVLAIAALAVLAAVVVVSLGHGGELTESTPDLPPLALPESPNAVDVVTLRLPVGLIGYHTQSVEETLRRVATAISERDTKIAVLEQQISELGSRSVYARQDSFAAQGLTPVTEHEPVVEPEVIREIAPGNELRIGHEPPSPRAPAKEVDAP